MFEKINNQGEDFVEEIDLGSCVRRKKNKTPIDIINKKENKEDRRFSYDPRLTGLENIYRVLQNSGIPEELLDDVEIESVKDSSLSEFNLYVDKIGNTALKVNYLGELAKLSGKTSNIHFYDRTLPIPETWKKKVMFIRDSELKNYSVDSYIKNRWLQDGYPFTGEMLSFEVQGTSGLLKYGRNIVDVTASVRSYGFTGTAKQRVQYFVDLNDKQAKYVVVINPFLNQVALTRKNRYVELAIPNDVDSKLTERNILERFLRETYGIIRGQVIIDEIDKEELLLVRYPDFKEQLRNPQNLEQEVESKAIKEYITSYLYTLSETKEEDEESSIVGNIRLVLCKDTIAKLIKNSNKYILEEDVSYRFKNENVRSFILSNHLENHVQFEISLGRKYDNIAEVFEHAKELILKYLDSDGSLVNIERDYVEDNMLHILITPSSEISEYAVGEIKALVKFTVTKPVEEDSENVLKINVNRNLTGYDGVQV